MANVEWTLKLFDVGGGGISAPNMNVISPGSSNEIEHATNRTLTMPLNGVDTLDFSVYLDDPMAGNINRLSTFVKLWRTVRNDGGSTIYSDTNPCFAGVVTYVSKNGADNIMNVKVQSPLWRLQSRFHLLNHYLKTNIETGEPYTQSELMWKLIDLVNNAFGLDDSNTGIVKGTFASGNDPAMAPYFVPKGSNTWTNIFEEIMNRPGGVDIVPGYIDDGSASLMTFSTAEKRGGSGASFRFHTGSGDNLDDLVEEHNPIPGEFANYLWAVGEGGPNSGKIAMRENETGTDGYSSIGIYMRRADYPDIKKIGLRLPKPTHLHAVAEAEFAQAQVPQTNYELSVSPAGGTYFGSHFGVGDVVSVVGSKGALSVNTSQRIYNVTLSISDNNMETAGVEVADDFTEAFI